MKNANALGFLQDGSGDFSATRLAFLLWSISVLVVWCYVSLVIDQGLAKVDQSILAIIGVLMTGKVVQSFSPNDGLKKA